jgi:molybdate transport system substrate-binding protein
MRTGVLRLVLAALAFGLVATWGCRPAEDAASPAELLVYCGSTMVHPVNEIARRIERERGVKVTVLGGLSSDLYRSIQQSREGDLYLPGTESFRTRYLSDGLLGEHVLVGYNQLALIVRKGNPRAVAADVRSLTRRDLAVIIGSPDLSSVGEESRRMLEGEGLYPQVFENALRLGTDSGDLSGAIKAGDADVALNWRATAFFPENRDHVEVLDLDPRIAIPQPLSLILLTTSTQPDVARRFMELAGGEEGQAIFRDYGFHGRSASFD